MKKSKIKMRGVKKQRGSLVDAMTGNPVVKGDVVTDFRGETATVESFELPRSAASTGRVYVAKDGRISGFYPSVFNLKVVR